MKNIVDPVKDEVISGATNVVDKGLKTKNEIVSNIKDNVEKGRDKVVETIGNTKEWSAKSSHVVNAGFKEKLEGVRDTIVDEIEGVINNLERTMQDIGKNIYNQGEGVGIGQNMVENYMNSRHEVGHKVVDEVGDKYKFVEGKAIELCQDGQHKDEGLGHTKLLEGKISHKVDALVPNDKRLNTKLERTMIEAYEGVVGKATELGQNVMGIVGDTYKDAKVKDNEIERKQFQRYEQAYEKGGEYVDKVKEKAYEGYEKGAKFGHNIGDKILDKYAKVVETTHGYVHDVKNNIHGEKEGTEGTIYQGQNEYKNGNAMFDQDLESRSRQVSHDIKMETLKGIRDQATKISINAQDYYDQEVDNERDDFYGHQYGNENEEVDHVGFLESFNVAKGIGILGKFNQMTDDIRDRTKEHDQMPKKTIEKGVEVAIRTLEEGGKKTQEFNHEVNDRVVEGGCEVVNVVSDTTSQAQEGYKIAKDEIANYGNNVVNSMKEAGQNLVDSTRKTIVNLKKIPSQENLHKPTKTSSEDYQYPNGKPLALGTTTNKESIDAIRSLSQPKHIESVIHLSQPQVHLIDPLVNGKLEGSFTDSTTIVEISPTIVSGYEDSSQSSQENKSFDSSSKEKEVAYEEE